MGVMPRAQSDREEVCVHVPISHVLPLQGCSVLVNYHQSAVEAKQIRVSLHDESSLIELAQGDASDIQWCQTLRQYVLKEY